MVTEVGELNVTVAGPYCCDQSSVSWMLEGRFASVTEAVAVTVLAGSVNGLGVTEKLVTSGGAIAGMTVTVICELDVSCVSSPTSWNVQTPPEDCSGGKYTWVTALVGLRIIKPGEKQVPVQPTIVQLAMGKVPVGNPSSVTEPFSETRPSVCLVRSSVILGPALTTGA